MTDDLSTLKNVQWIEEEELRRDVAAQIEMECGPDAGDQDELQKAWLEFQGAERRVMQLEEQHKALEHAQAEKEALTVAATGSVDPTTLGKVSFLLKSARRELDKKGKALQRTQILVERRQSERLRAVKESQGAAAVLEESLQHERDARTEDALEQGAQSLQKGRGTPGHLMKQLVVPSTVLPAPVRPLPRSPPDHLCDVTPTSYHGGEVLPSLNRVMVSRAHLRGNQLSYEDDTDLETYYARQQKRRRLEMAEALVRHRQQLQEAGAKGEVKDEDDVTIKVEHSAQQEGPVSGRRGSVGLVRKDKDSVEVIDVDALMDAEEGVGAAIARQVLSQGSSKSVSPSRGVKREAEEAVAVTVVGEDRQWDSRLSASGGGVTLEDGENIERAYHALELPAEPEVMLFPGITLPLSTYEGLLDYQQEGVRWLLHLHMQRSGGILGDEMGLGKTVEVAVLLHALHRSRQLRGPVLIVAPMTVLRQWVTELHRWAPALRVCVMHESSSSAMSRESLVKSVQGSTAVVMATYAAMRLHCDLLHTAGFQYLILDEGHKIANPEAGVTLAAKSFGTPHRLLLTGSPVQNSLKELWCLFDFVRPGLFGALSRFVDEFQTPITMSKNTGATPLALATAVACAKTLRQHMAPYLLRRLKRQVRTLLPKKYERVLRVPLGDEQLEQYVELVSSPEVQRIISQTLYSQQLLGGLDRNGRDSSGSLHVAGRRFYLSRAARQHDSRINFAMFRTMNRLRQICNHADLFAVLRSTDDNDADGGHAALRKRPRSFRSNNPVRLEGGCKLRVLADMLGEWIAFGHRALVFSQTRMMLDIIENLCDQAGYRYVRIDGTTAGSHRQELISRFNTDQRIFLALLTTRVGGVGVNLTGADRVVIYDPDWNPVTDAQARERSWRFGQTRDVCVYRLITTGTVEETILRRQLAKTYVTDKVLKDPHLQRFFHQHETLSESFFLGAEYESRVPPHKKHVLAAQKPRYVAGDRLDDADAHGDVSEGEGEGDNSTNKQLGEREFGQLLSVTAEVDPASPASPAAPLVLQQGGATPASVAPNIKMEGDADGDGNDDSDGAETGLLKRLVNGQDVVVSGSDAATRQLALLQARQSLNRVTRQAARSLLDQQREFSLMHAARKR